MNILYFAVGNSPIIHMQAQYALRTAYAQIGADDALFILTDSPALYENLPFVHIDTITSEEKQEWGGNTNISLG